MYQSEKQGQYVFLLRAKSTLFRQSINHQNGYSFFIVLVIFGWFQL